MRAAAPLLALALALAAPALAQEAAPPPASPVLTLNQERLYQESAYGRAAEARYQAEAEAHTAENRRLEDALEAEERDLTERRAKMPAADFAPLAAAFDQKVEEIRAAQEAKGRDILRQRDEARQRFSQAVVAILGDLLIDHGASVILPGESVVIALSALDVTDEAIALVDARLPAPEEGGAEEPAPAPEGPQPAP